MQIIVDPAQQHGLVHQRDAGVHEASAGGSGGGRQFGGMREMHAEPQWAVPPEHAHERRRDALGQYRRNFCADANEFDVRNRANGGQTFVQRGVVERQGVAAGNQYVGDVGIAAQPRERQIPTDGAFAGGARAGAIAAERGAIARGEQQNFVGIGANQPRRDGVGGFTQGVGIFAGNVAGFAHIGQHGAPQGTIRFIIGEQGKIIRRNGQRHAPGIRRMQPAQFARGQIRQRAGNGRGVTNAMPQLPAPVMPLRGGGRRK